MNELESIQIDASKYAMLEDLMRQDGWKVLLEHISRVKRVVMDKLMVEKDINEVIRLQERYRAFDSVISTIESAKSIKDKLINDINIIREDEELAKEFDV